MPWITTAWTWSIFYAPWLPNVQRHLKQRASKPAAICDWSKLSRCPDLNGWRARGNQGQFDLQMNRIFVLWFSSGKSCGPINFTSGYGLIYLVYYNNQVCLIVCKFVFLLAFPRVHHKHIEIQSVIHKIISCLWNFQVRDIHSGG